MVKTVMPFPEVVREAKGCVSADYAKMPVVSSGGWRLPAPTLSRRFLPEDKL